MATPEILPIEKLPALERAAWDDFLKLLDAKDLGQARNKLRLVLGHYTRNMKEIPPEVLEKFNQLKELERHGDEHRQ
jgi:hypothetical protein